MKRASTDTTQAVRAAAAAERLRSVTGPADGLSAITEILSQLLGAEEYALFAVNAAGTRLSLVASQGIDATGFRDRAASEGLIGRVARRGAAFIARKSGIVGSRAEDEAALTACIPLTDGGKVAGVLAIFRLLPHKRSLASGDTELLDLLSAHGAIALRSGGTNPAATATQAPVDAPGAPVAPGQLRGVVVYPGDIFVSDTSVEISTILGSCVAVCIWDTRFRFGGMSHFLLPNVLSGQANPLRFGDAAIPAFLAGLDRLGSQRQNLRAKLFGGAAVNGAGTSPAGATLGSQNVVIARRLLTDAGIPIAAEDVGGTTGRKIRFRTDDGTALVRRLESA